MEYILEASDTFVDQLKQLSEEGARVVKDKLRLIELNPFRNKRIQGYGLFLFRVRFEDGRKEKRVIYFVDKPKIKLICILDRDKKYKGLRKVLKNLGYI